MKHLGKMQAAVGLSVMGAFFGACYAVWFHPLIEGGARDVALILIGTLAAAFGSVVNWYFGSSSGSARKDAVLLHNNEKEQQ